MDTWYAEHQSPWSALLKLFMSGGFLHLDEALLNKHLQKKPEFTEKHRSQVHRHVILLLLLLLNPLHFWCYCSDVSSLRLNDAQTLVAATSYTDR